MTAAVPITIAPPDVQHADVPGQHVNLFLYKIDENASLKNMDLPGRTSAGAYGRPPLALDLHYLMTAYGDNEEDHVAAQEILGDAMRVLHDNGVVLGVVLDPVLRDEFENVKLYLEPLSLEELSKIWSALTLPMRLSSCYRVTVVQIESRNPRKYPRLVGELPAAGPRVKALPVPAMRIESISVNRAGDPPESERVIAYARVGDRLIVRGSGFPREGLSVFLGVVDATAQLVNVDDKDHPELDRVDVTIPDDAALQPGPIPLRLQLSVSLGDPEVPHLGIPSNIAVFVLVPGIAALNPNLGVNPRTLEINGTRLFHPAGESLAVVGTGIIRSPQYGVSTPQKIRFDLPAAFGAGQYPVRVRVNGAESFEETLVIP
jgi:hypothetical protein